MNFPGQAPSPFSQSQQAPTRGSQNYAPHQNTPPQPLQNPLHNTAPQRQQHMQPQGQAMSAAAAAARRKQMAMLPPQFQNLSPQQLQELKNQPQFQNMLRQYLQRQQMMQQQMMQQQMMNPNQMGQPGMMSNSQMNQLGQMNQSQMNQSQMNQSQMNQSQMNQSQMNQSQMNQSQLNQNQLNQNQLNQNLSQSQINQNLNQNQTQFNQNQIGQSRREAFPNAAGRPDSDRQFASQSLYNASMQAKPPSVQSLQQQNQQNVQNLQSMQNQQALGVHAPSGPSATPAAPFSAASLQKDPRELDATAGPRPFGTGHGARGPELAAVSGADDMAVAAAAAAAAAAGSANHPAHRQEPTAAANPPRTASEFVSEPAQIPAQFAPSAAADMPLERMGSLRQWSQAAEKAGEPVSLELKMYEDAIKKDEVFLRKYEAHAGRTRQAMQKMASDIKSYGAIKQLRMNAIGTSAKNQLNNSIWGEGYQGYGNGITNTATRVILPSQNKSHVSVPEIAMTESEINQAVMQGDQAGRKALVPIRLDFDKEKDKFKLRDTFLWDLNEQVLPLEAFVKTLIEDYKFISESHFHDIYQAITEQIKDFRAKPASTMGEIRVPIKIDLLINNTQFTDQFEWDILNSLETDPEDFAGVLCDEMGLPGDFATAIAFSIREQAQMYHKALFLVGYTFDGSPIREDEIRSRIAPPLRAFKPDSAEEDFVTTLRNPASLVEYSPSMNKLSHPEIEKIDKEMERESRRRRRQLNTETFSYNENGNNNFTGVARSTTSRRSALHSGRGAKTSLPNLSDIPRMFRTPMPSGVLPGGVDLGVPDIYGYSEFIVNRTQVPNPDHKPPAPRGMVTSFKDTAGSFYVRIKLPRKR